MDLLMAMRVYVRVVERGSLSAAARDLGMGQPAVSERIERLEAHLGSRLLLRSTRSLSMTDAGAVFYERARQTLEAAADAVAAVGPDQPLRGTLRLAAPHGVGEVLLPPILLCLRRSHPDLDIDLVLNDRVVDPVTEGVDLSLRLGDSGEGAFIARPLGHVRRLLVAAPEYMERHGAPAGPHDLGGHDFVRVGGLFANGRLPLVAEDGKAIAAPIRIRMSLGHWRPAHALLLGGAGIGVLQAPVCTADVAAGRLVPLLPGHRVPGFDLHALYPVSRQVPPKVRMVLDLLRRELPAVL
ncbi:LysR family transcriptional regulator [Nitrospirillum sp. BR 11164]|uniref:LysR family transcriptional regulator n=1 Tax=Nitrospirillum sp. BR 11164 TaxID=3104324 RepID=UPI002AFFA30D|nr:LysR family transcriptional regulator [Nitrospirillum sp. BR 11164]MEA1650674.1 LysR family transcriptional regulator [Nitrospirillum sp. BR 11164]